MAKKKKLKVTRKPWSKTDVRELKRLAKSKVGVVRAAKALKRTRGAVQVRASALGISLKMR